MTRLELHLLFRDCTSPLTALFQQPGLPQNNVSFSPVENARIKARIDAFLNPKINDTLMF